MPRPPAMKCGQGHPLSGDNLYIAPGSGRRECWTCKQARNYERDQREPDTEETPPLIEGPAPPSRPPCTGQGGLFNSTNLFDHEQAKAICLGCPIRDWCEAERARVAAASLPGYGPEGTWAGKFYPPGGELPPHGTVERYRMARTLNEKPCDKCKRAAALDKARRRTEKRIRDAS